MRIVLFLLVLGFTSCQKHVHLSDVQYRYYSIEEGSYPLHAVIVGMIEPYKTGVDSVMNVVIGYAEEELVKGKPSSTLTNWVTDALHEATQKLVTDKIDFTVQNYGGIRIPTLASGEVTIRTMYELMPFDNVMVLVPMTGVMCLQLLDHFADAGGWPVSQEVRFKIHYGKATDISIGGQPLDTSAQYIVAMPDYVANGGDNYTFLKGLPQISTQVLVRDLLIDHIRRNKKLKADHSSRITQ